MMFVQRMMLLLAIGAGLLYPQFTVIKESFAGKRYVLALADRGAVDDVRTDIGTSGAFERTADVYIAVPPGTRPAISVSAVRLRSASVGTDAEQTTRTAFTAAVKGYLWIDNFYCVHLSVSTSWKDRQSNSVVVPSEIQAVLEFERPLTTASVTTHGPVPAIIANTLGAGRWPGVQPEYAVAATDSWIDYSQQYVKLGVNRDGIVRIRQTDLTAYGVPTGSIDPSLLKIYKRGAEIPIYVFGQHDGTFDAQDYIEFLGQRNYGDPRYREIAPTDSSYYEYLDRYSDTTIYWLRWTGGNGMRIDTATSVSGGQADTVRFYDHFLHTERDFFWDFALTGGDLRKNYPDILENETWNDNPVAIGRSPVTFAVSDIFPNRQARAFIKLQDYASSLTTAAHTVALSINNGPIRYDSSVFDKYQVKVLKAQFPSSVLNNGNNTVDLHSFTVPGNSVNTVIKDWTELEYPRYIKTITDSILFGYQSIVTPNRSLVIVTGLTSNAVSLYRHNRTTGSITKITNYVRSNDTLRFVDSVSNNTYYYLLRESKIAAPIFFYKKQFANLRQSSNTAEYIAITHPTFMSSAQSYVSFIGAQYGVTTKLVDINDIYDEYNYGYFSPIPIKEFLKSTHTYWQAPKPKYVFLIGKGTYDFYGNKTKYFGVPKTGNFIPPFGNPVSDIWFVQWDTTGSLIPQMSIGRLPAKNVDEFQHYFAKHQKYVGKGFDEWNKRYIFFSGGNITDLNQLAQSKGVNDFIINNYVAPAPIGGSSANFYKTPSPNVTNFGPYTAEYLKTSLDNGGVFISYIGHSGTQTWDNSITDITQLSNNRDRNPMISDFGCSTGKFAEPDITSFSENAVNNIKGQAISYIGNSSLGFTSTAFTFPQVFYKKLLVDTSASLGDIHRLAKIDYLKQYGSSGSYGLFVKTNSLVGDPIVTLPIPTKPNLSLSNAVIAVDPERPTDQDDSARFIVRYYNLGFVRSDSIEFTVTVEHQGFPATVRTIKRKMPLYNDSLSFSIRTAGSPGEYDVTVVCDQPGVFDEIYENDNTVSYQLIVASTKIKNIVLSPVLQQLSPSVFFLNPMVNPAQSTFFLDVSTNPLFTGASTVQSPYDTFSTKVTLSNTLTGKRVWLRSRSEQSSSPGLPISFIVGSRENILISDSISFATIALKNVKVQETGMVLDTSRTVFSSISGGFNDGNTAVILKNGENFVPENTLRGFHVCIFDSVNYGSKWYFRFDVQSGASVAASFKTMLDTLPSGYIVLIAVSNDVASTPANFPATLKTALKNYGSKYIDSVDVADSWTIMGRKGAVKGSVPEKFSRRYAAGGPIRIDTTIIIPNKQGTFATTNLGPVKSWRSLETRYNAPAGSSITLGLLGITSNNTVDTLRKEIPIDTLINVDTIDAVQYPYLKVIGDLKAGSGNISPVVSSIAVNYDRLPELGTNYQVFKGYRVVNNAAGAEITSADTITQGSKVQFTYRIYNAGGTTAKNVGYKLTSTWENNYVEQITAATADSIAPDGYKEFTTQYSTSLGSGKRTIKLTIDPDTLIREIYKDNNIYTFPIVIKRSAGNPLLPNLAITQNAVTSVPAQVTDETDTARFTIVYANTGALVNDSLSIQIKHYYLSDLRTTTVIRRKYPVAYDTIRFSMPVRSNAGSHQLSIELDHTGLITESSESDNLSNYYFTVATTEFKVIAPTASSIAFVNKIVFLNPTANAGAGSIVNLQLDTMKNFTVPTLFSSAIQPFATSFSLPGLKRSKRYYWRVKLQSGSSDWTTGSFFSGDSVSAELGQLDAQAWSENTFTRTAHSADSGARIVDSKFIINAVSAGFSDGNTASAEVNGVNIITPILGSGHHLIVLDTSAYSVTAMRRFDLAADAAEADSLVQFINAVPVGRTVIDVVADEGSNNLSAAARNALKSIGSTLIDQLTFRDSWSIIGRKGAAQGTVPEMLKPQNSGTAAVETTIVRPERNGTIVTPLIGPFTTLSDLKLNATIPSGAQLQVQFVGLTAANTFDTVVTAVNQTVIPLGSVSTKQYRNGKLVFRLSTPSALRTRRSAGAIGSPVLSGWTAGATTSTELAVSGQSSTVDRNQVMEGETIQFSGKVFNVSPVTAESILVQLSSNAAGIDNILKQQRFLQIAAGDSVPFSFAYDTRGKRGNHAFTFEIDPLDSLAEQSKANNAVTIPYVVFADTLRPTVQITFDGSPVLNGDYVGQQPEIRIRLTDNNPSAILPSDTSNFLIKLNNTAVPFTTGTAELLNTNAPGRADVRWTPMLSAGENVIQISAKDISGNYSDTILLYVNVATDFRLLDVFNIPNPFTNGTQFTFNLAGPTGPDEVIIKIYTVAGRLIKELPVQGTIGFNKIPWDGRDNDGDEIGNGVYLYKVIVKQGSKQVEGLSKLVKMR
jgi:hypothetical protein